MQLSNIAITHISLVKSGANGKSLIYKSVKEQGKYEKNIEIRKTDAEQGVVFGIVYTPDQTDTQGDTATADEIKKAAYAFMKSKNIDNVDVEHSFDNVDAFVAESWIVKSGDEHFPNDVGAWAVAIQLESEELKELAKSGDIAGLSMAGAAVCKSEDNKKGMSQFFESLVEVMSGVYIDIHTRIEKGEKVDMDNYKDDVKAKMQKATASAGAELDGVVASVEKADDELKKLQETIELQTKEIEDLKVEAKAKDEELKKLLAASKETSKEVEEVKKSAKDTRDALKKSNQQNKPNSKKSDEDEDEKGVL